MRITIKATHIEMTDALKEYIEIRLRSLEDLIRKWDLEGLVEARVEVERTTRHHHKGNVYRAEVHMNVPRELIRAEHEAEDIRLAIDVVRGELHRQIVSYNDRHQHEL